jgi:hypothetical protein
MTNQISLSDHYVVLLQNVVDQAKALRQEINKDKQQEKEALANIAIKVDVLSTTVKYIGSTTGRRVKNTGGAAVKAPRMCSVSTLITFNL